MPPQFRRGKTRRGRRGGRAQRAHVGASREGRHPVHASAGHAAAHKSGKAPVSRSHHERDARRRRPRRKARAFTGRRRRLGRDPLRRARRGDDACRHQQEADRDGAPSRAEPRYRARLSADGYARPERSRQWRVRRRFSSALACVRTERRPRDRRGHTHPRRGRAIRVFDDASGDVSLLRVVDRKRMAAEEDVLQRPAGAGARADVGVRTREGPRTDVRVRAPHGRSRQRMRRSGTYRRWAVGVVTALRRWTRGVRRCAGAGAPGFHSDSRAEDLFFGPRRERVASPYWSTSAATFRAATGIFTAQPTPNTCSLKI
jgi:hypothetical protein